MILMNPEAAVTQSLSRLVNHGDTPDAIKKLLEEVLIHNTPKELVTEMHNQARKMAEAKEDLYDFRPYSGNQEHRDMLDTNNKLLAWQYFNQNN
jgi:hypothetical protein